MGSIAPAFPADNAAAVAEVEQLLAALKGGGGGEAANDEPNPPSAGDLLRRVDKIRCLLQTPAETMKFQNTCLMVVPVLNAMIEMGVFDAVPLAGAEGDGGGIGLEKLAAKVGMDPEILARFLNMLLVQGLLEEPAPRVYRHGRGSAVFRQGGMRDYYRLGSWSVGGWWRVAEYLATHAPGAAYDAARSPNSWAAGREGASYYELLEADAAFSDVWHKGMAQAAPLNPVLGMFPFAALRDDIVAAPDDDAAAPRAFVVDVGGGRGNALVDMLRECAGTVPGPMVLQDLPEVLEGKDPVRLDGIETMPYNFLDEQPVKNAHVYFLRKVMHNYYDDKCRRILQRVVDAMGPTSRLLLGEMILPDRAAPGGDPLPFWMDLRMFMLTGTERSEAQWQRLLDSVGLTIVKIWRLPGAPHQATIEARLAKTE